MNQDFPKGFLWGAATSAHQVEGGLADDWTAWEAANARRLAAEAAAHWAGGSPVWADIKSEATDPATYRSGQAADHYARYHQDIELMLRLGLTAYRFTIPWSRIEPADGQFDPRALAHYADLVKRLRYVGIEPFPTLWHWPLPLWLARRGGWLAPDAIDRFRTFVDHVVSTLAQDVRYWLTLNEPNVYASHSYLLGLWPPQHKNLLGYYRVLAALKSAHRAAYRIIKDHSPTSKVGIAHHVTDVTADANPANHVIKWWVDRTWNWSFLDAIQHELDFVGVNNYFRRSFGDTRSSDTRRVYSLSTRRVNEGRVKENRQVHTRKSDLGWNLEPESLAGAVEATWQRYRKPIIVTEHGLADRTDKDRQWFIEESLRHLHAAVERGADVRGYLHWSLLDNFEWDKGFWPRFGLIEVDYATQKRTLRPSARRYAQIAKRNALN